MNAYVAEERQVSDRVVADDIDPLRMRGLEYPPHNSDPPILDRMDMADLAAAIFITLGPLAAYAVGMGA